MVFRVLCFVLSKNLISVVMIDMSFKLAHFRIREVFYALSKVILSVLMLVLFTSTALASEEFEAAELWQLEEASLLLEEVPSSELYSASGAMVGAVALVPGLSQRLWGGVRAMGGKKWVMFLATSFGVALSVWKMNPGEDIDLGTSHLSLSKGMEFEPSSGSQKPSPKPLLPLSLEDHKKVFEDGESGEPLEELDQEAQNLEKTLTKAQQEDYMISRVLQFRLRVYAHQRGIKVKDIPQSTRTLMEQEVASKYVNKLSDLSQDRYFSLLESFAEQDLKAAESVDKQNTHNFKKYLKWVLGACTTGFVCLLFL